MLHLVQSRSGLEKCKSIVQQDDDVVFIGDGVLCAQAIANCRVFIQMDDATRCGVSVGENGKPCSMNELVELVAQHDQTVSWR